MANSIIQFRIDDNLKNEATEIYEALGIDLSTAMRMFLKRSVAVKGIPFSMVLSDNELVSMKALRAMTEMQNISEENGLSDMSLDDINAEIAAARSERKKADGAQ